MTTKTLNTGRIPKSKLMFEDLEGYLGCYAMTYEHLKTSNFSKDREAYQRMMTVLGRIAARYNLLSPEDACIRSRTENPQWKPQKMDHPSAIKGILNFYQPFQLDPHFDQNENDFTELDDLLYSRTFRF